MYANDKEDNSIHLYDKMASPMNGKIKNTHEMYTEF